MRVPAVVLAAAFAFASLGAVWSVVAPLGEAPDEPAHLALVLHLAAGHGYPDYDGLHNQQAIIRLCSTYAAATRACPRKGEPVTSTSMRRHLRGDAPDKGTRPAWDDEGGATALGQLNQMPQHPPLYYEAMAVVLRMERAVHGGPWSLDRELALLRLVNVLLVAPLPILAWWAAKRLGLDHATSVAAAVATLGLPMLTHIGATLNNDNLLNLSGAVLVALLAGVVRGDRSRRTAVAVGLTIAVAMLTKAFGVLFPVAAVVAYAVAWHAARTAATSAAAGSASGWRTRLRTLATEPLVVAGVVSAVLAGWWYVRVRVRTGKFAPTIEEQRLTTALRPPGFHASIGKFGAEAARALDQRFWGSFGWYTVRLSTGLTYALTAVLVAGLLGALARGPVATPGEAPAGAPRRRDLVVLLVPVALLLVFVLQHAWSVYARSSKFQFLQGRYLFAGIVGVAVVFAVGVGRAIGRWAPIGIVASAGTLQLWSLHRCLADYWGAPGLGPRGQGRALVAWSGWPGPVVGLFAIVAVAGAAVLVATLLADVRAPRGTLGGPQAAEGGPVGSSGP